MPTTLNINADAVVKYTNKLEKLHFSGLPVAVRRTLNSAAFDMKSRSLLLSAEKSFVTRKPNFIKGNSTVVPAVGFNVKRMRSVVGFLPINLKGKNNYAVQDLRQQEFGGTIKGRSFIPQKKARGNNALKPVTAANRMEKIPNVVNSNKVPGVSRKQSFAKAAILAKVGGFVIGNFPKKKLVKITSINKSKGGSRRVRSTKLYSFEKNRSVEVSSTGFVAKARLASSLRIQQFFLREAQKQLNRLRLK